jgi:hypothetical protein
MTAPATHRAFRWIPMNDNALPLPEWHDGLPGAYRWLQARLQSAAGCTEFEFHLPWIDAIRRLKERRGAIRALPANADPQSLARIRETLTRSLGPQRDRDVLARTRPALRGDSRQALVARALVDATLVLPASIGAHHWQAHAAAADPPLRTGA